jgi:hypothetical protein
VALERLIALTKQTCSPSSYRYRDMLHIAANYAAKHRSVDEALKACKEAAASCDPEGIDGDASGLRKSQ